MCSISGVLAPKWGKGKLQDSMARNLLKMIGKADNRGRDSWGVYFNTPSGLTNVKELGQASKGFTESKVFPDFSWALNNNRAEPTTEYVRKKSLEDIQPFEYGGWVVTHNGTIANDKELYRKYYIQPRTRIDTDVIPLLLQKRFGNHFDPQAIIRFLEAELVGSYALAIGHRDQLAELVIMCNYKPLYLARHKQFEYLMFTSLETYLQSDTLQGSLYGEFIITPVKPYSGIILKATEISVRITEVPFISIDQEPKALIVCSGGLDSTVTASWAQRQGYNITLLHFLYKCRAETKEREAVASIGKRLGCDVVYIDTSIFKDVIGGSRLTETSSGKVAEGEAGAEFAHEWVPARNLIMLSIATGYAEAKGFQVIMLGTNLEEAGSYPDNEMIFIDRLNAVLPYATQVNKRVHIEMPVGNLVKHEIVRMGIELDAPLDLCWSCYESGDIHCGNCGPCFLRKTAFKINGLTDMIPYST